jgi:hypothetical protein
MNFRALIARAMNEAREEFAGIVAAKLAALMGDAEPSRSTAAPAKRLGRPPKTRSTKRQSAKAEAKPRRAPARSEGRASPEHMQRLREKVLSVMHPGLVMKKAEIMKAGRFDSAEETRVAHVLHVLKDERVLKMHGVRGSATYTRVGD